MFGMKYVVYTDGTFAIFPQTISHNEMRIMGKTVRSAGFLDINSVNDGSIIDVTCFGKSESLGVESIPVEDKEDIELGYRISNSI